MTRPCPRCGLVREARPGSICRDCRDVLTPDEIGSWVNDVTCGHVSEFGVCVARRGHLLGHDFAVVEQRTEPYVLDAALTVGERNR